jgi:hypothetical protein
VIKVVLRRSELREHDACPGGRRLFRSIAPKGVWAGEWTMLHALWLATVHPGYSAWLIERRLNLDGARVPKDFKAPKGWRLIAATCTCCMLLAKDDQNQRTTNGAAALQEAVS